MATEEPESRYYDNYILAIDVGFANSGVALFDRLPCGKLDLVDVKCFTNKKTKKNKEKKSKKLSAASPGKDDPSNYCAECGCSYFDIGQNPDEEWILSELSTLVPRDMH